MWVYNVSNLCLNNIHFQIISIAILDNYANQVPNHFITNLVVPILLVNSHLGIIPTSVWQSSRTSHVPARARVSWVALAAFMVMWGNDTTTHRNDQNVYQIIFSREHPQKNPQKVWTISKAIQGFLSWESSIQLAFDLKGEDRELMSQWATSKGKTHDLDTVFSNESERYREK